MASSLISSWQGLASSSQGRQMLNNNRNKMESVEGWPGRAGVCVSPPTRPHHILRWASRPHLGLTLLPGLKSFTCHLQVRKEIWLPSARNRELFTILSTCRRLAIWEGWESADPLKQVSQDRMCSWVFPDSLMQSQHHGRLVRQCYLHLPRIQNWEKPPEHT